MGYHSMKRLISLAAILILAAVPFHFSRAQSSAGATSWQDDLLAWRSKRAASLQAPEGWLSLVGLEWLKEGDNSFGSAPDNRIQLAKAPAHVGTVHLEKGALRLVAPPGGFPKELLVDGHPPQEQTLYADDGAQPSKLKVGTLTVIIIHRDERYGLRIKGHRSANPNRFPWSAMVFAKCGLPNQGALDSVQSAEDARYPHDPRDGEQASRAGCG